MVSLRVARHSWHHCRLRINARANYSKAFRWLIGYALGFWIVAVLLILITAVLGTIIPAARASRVDPVKALRIE